jgi:hypothetical protein
MRHAELSNRDLLAKFAESNLLFLGLLFFFLYFTPITIGDYFSFMQYQVLSWVATIVCAKVYDKIRFKKNNQNKSIYKSSIYIGAIIASGLLLVFSELSLHKINSLEIISVFGAVAVMWILFVFCVLNLSKVFRIKWYIALLDMKISYKNLLQILLLFNLSFGILILLFITLNNKYSIIEFLFILLYLEIGFIVFHIVVAKFIDVVWSNSHLKDESVSLYGLVVASIIYVIKIRLVEEKFFGVFNNIYINNYKAFTLMISLILFWIFFVLLFSFKITRQKKHQNLSNV